MKSFIPIKQSEQLAEEMMDNIIFDNGFSNRLCPFDEKKHYADYKEKIAKEILKISNIYGFDIFTDEVVETLSIGESSEIEELVEKYQMEDLDKILNEYFEYLGTIPNTYTLVPAKSPICEDEDYRA